MTEYKPTPAQLRHQLENELTLYAQRATENLEELARVSERQTEG